MKGVEMCGCEQTYMNRSGHECEKVEGSIKKIRLQVAPGKMENTVSVYMMLTCHINERNQCPSFVDGNGFKYTKDVR